MQKRRREFVAWLEKARTARNLTLRGLADLAQMKHTYLALIKRGERGVGPGVATRLADALNLAGPERQRFLDLAAQTSAGSSATPDLSSAQQTLGHITASFLRCEGIDAGKIHTIASIEVGMPFGGAAGRLWVVCQANAKPAPLLPNLLKHIRSLENRRVLMVVFQPRNKQTLVDCGLVTFAD